MTRLFARLTRLAACGLLVFASSQLASAAELSKPLKPGQFNPKDPSVEMFEAMKAGKLEVKVIHKSEAGGKLLFVNKTDQPLNVKLPETFATVHVLAQLAGGGGGVGSTGGIFSGLGQGTGGGMGGGGGGMGGGGGAAGGGAGMFNVAPERVGELPFTSVCLEHGKPSPRSSMHYEIRPLTTLSDNAEVGELIKMLNAGTISQRVAQVLAWHLNNEMSFEQLAAKTINRLDGSSYSYFSVDEVRAAMAAKDYIAKQLEDRKANPEAATPKL